MSELANARLVDDSGAPKDRIVGFETEYGTWVKRQYYQADPDAEAKPIGDRWRPIESHEADYTMRYNNIDSLRSEEFKGYGDRVYLDVGTHPEQSTAEETSFVNASHRLLKGHLRMAQMFDPKQNPALGKLGITDVKLAANTADAAGNSWSSHENYLARRELSPWDYVDALSVHHLSRIVWSGAGAVFLNSRDSSYRFTLSEKAEHIWEGVGAQTTRSRPLVNTRDEPLADPRKYRRIHVVCGESVMSGFANALRLASGSIVLRACELGVDFSDLETSNPIRSIRTISRDPTLKAKVELVNGDELTGIELQRLIAERSIKAAEAADYLTEQERYWGEEWVNLLDDLESDPNECADCLDWPIKQQAIEREVEAKRGGEESVRNIAISKALHYHQLLPEEGLGMQMVRLGKFVTSPTAEVLEGDMPLPETRAKIRGEAITRLANAGMNPLNADWYLLRFDLRKRTPRILLADPYATTDNKVEYCLDRLRA